MIYQLEVNCSDILAVCSTICLSILFLFAKEFSEFLINLPQWKPFLVVTLSHGKADP